MILPDMALAQQDTGVVDGLGQTKLEDLGLEAALQEVLNLEGVGKHVPFLTVTFRPST
jgi:hypothetical protein